MNCETLYFSDASGTLLSSSSSCSYASTSSVLSRGDSYTVGLLIVISGVLLFDFVRRLFIRSSR